VHPIDIPDRPAPTIPISAAYRAGHFVFVSGHIATRPDGSVFIGDFADEVTLALDNVELALRAAGADLSRVVKVGAWLSNPLLFGVFNTVYASRLGTARPARTTVAVGFAHPDVRIEIDAIAYLGG
jgi:2-iminobutanoate/2-iminopropanoate deaminase